MRRSPFQAVLWLWVGCDCDTLAPAAPAAAVSWDNTVHPLLVQHCRACHGRLSPDRHGAPAHAVYDTESEVRGDAPNLYARVCVESGAPMPPDAPIPPDDLAALCGWLGDP